MSSFNQATLVGYLGQDPTVLKQTESGHFVRLSLATTQRYTDADNTRQERVTWHTVYVNSRLGSACATHLKKGARVLVQGDLRYTDWTDAKSGQQRASAGIYAKEVLFLSQLPSDQAQSTESAIAA